MSVDSWIPELWVREMVRELRPALRLARLVNRDFNAQVQQRGNTVNVPLPPMLQARTLTRGGTLAFDDADTDTTPVVLDQHFYAAYGVNDIDEAQTNVSVLQSYGRAAARAIAEKVENFLHSKYVDATHAVGTAGVKLPKSALLRARTLLAESNAPLAENWWALTSVKDGEGLIDDLSNTTAASVQGDQSALRSGQIGRLYNFDVYETNMAVSVPGTPVTTHSLAGHRDAITFVTRALPTPPAGTGVVSAVYVDPDTGITVRVMLSYNRANLRYEVSYDVLCGAKVIMPELLVDLVS